MKKIVALLLALMLVFSLAAMIGCSDDVKEDNKTPADDATDDKTDDAKTDDDTKADDGTMTKEELEASKPGEYIQEKLDAGIPVILQFSGFVDNQAIMVEYAGRVEEVCKEYGVQFEKTHAGGDVTQQIAQIENYISMGSNVIFLIPPDGASVKDAVQKAQDAGIAVMIYGCPDAGYAVSTFGDQWVQGWMSGEVMYEYFHVNNPDAAAKSEKVIFIGTKAIDPQLQKYTGMEQSITSHEEFDLVYTYDGLEDTIDSGYDQLENALTAEPDARYIMMQNCIPTLGASNYIAAMPGANLEDYNIFLSGEDQTTRDLYEMTLNGEACVRGTVQSDKNEGEYMQDITRMVFNNEVFKDYELIMTFAAITVGWDFDYTSDDVDMSLCPFDYAAA